MQLAPIIVFTFNRPGELGLCLDSLSRNLWAAQSEIYIFCDGPKNRSDATKIRKSERLTQDYKKSFYALNWIQNENNIGLKKNITGGLDWIFREYKSAIVLEDDNVVNSYFIEFMNRCLQEYENKKNVWHINAWTFFDCELENDVFLSTVMHCWGWATWKDRWGQLNPEPAFFIKNMTIREKWLFNCEGKFPFYSQLIGNFLGKTDTWAIQWYATIFSEGGFCVSPKNALVKNIGTGDAATHSPIYDLCSASRGLQTKRLYIVSTEDKDKEKVIKQQKRFFEAKLSRKFVFFQNVKILIPYWCLILIRRFYK